MTKCNVKEGTLPLLFWQVPKFISVVLAVNRLQAPTVKIFELNEEGNMVMGTVAASANFTTVREMLLHCSGSFTQGISRPAMGLQQGNVLQLWCQFAAQITRLKPFCLCLWLEFIGFLEVRGCHWRILWVIKPWAQLGYPEILWRATSSCQVCLQDI